MLNILVCIKQVPDTTNIKIDPVTNTLIREGVPSIVNPFDAYALELAVRLKEQAGGTGHRRLHGAAPGPEGAADLSGQGGRPGLSHDRPGGGRLRHAGDQLYSQLCGPQAWSLRRYFLRQTGH